MTRTLPKRCRSVVMIGTHPTTMGGVATVVRGYLEAGLTERVDCVYVATHRDGSSFQKLAIAITSALRIVALLLSRRKPLLHVHCSSRASFWRKSAICLAALAVRRPYLIHMHGSEFMKFYEQESGPKAQAFIRYVLARAALVIALSEGWKRDLLRISPSCDVEVLPNSVSIPPRMERASTGSQGCRVLFLGRIGDRKGTFDLVRAFAGSASSFSEATLVCAGDGAAEKAQALAAELGVGRRVSFPGWVGVREAREELAAAGIFALPSHAEGLPMALLEAMSYGLAVVTTPVGGIPEVVKDGINGVLIPPGDVAALAGALQRLFGDATERQRLGAAARATIIDNFAIEATLERLLAIYQRFGVEARTPRRS